MSKPAKPRQLPDVLLGEPPSVKLLYLWLAQQGEVKLPQRRIAAALGLTQANVSLTTHRLVELGLVERRPDEVSRVQKSLRVAGRARGS